MKQKNFCPLSKTYCILGECMFWVDETAKCAVTQIAESTICKNIYSYVLDDDNDFTDLIGKVPSNKKNK